MNYIEKTHPKQYYIVNEFGDILIGVYSNKYVAEIVLKSLKVADKFGIYKIYHNNTYKTFDEMVKHFNNGVFEWKVDFMKCNVSAEEFKKAVNSQEQKDWFENEMHKFENEELTKKRAMKKRFYIWILNLK